MAKAQILLKDEEKESIKVLQKEGEIRREKLVRLANRNIALKRAGLSIGLLAIVLLAMLWFNRRGAKRAEGYGKQLMVVSESLEKSLDEKDSLLREIHHRVKNNLQLISSILSLEQGMGKNKTVNQTIEDSSTKIKAMALLHELFYNQEDEEAVNIALYCQKLINLVKESYGDTSKIAISLSSPEIVVPISKITPLGLIINECLSNSIKYAFDKNGGDIQLTIKRVGEQVYIKIKDNGKGLPPDFDMSNVKSLGLKLIKRLTERQLQGTYSIQNAPEGGVVNHITFII